MLVRRGSREAFGSENYLIQLMKQETIRDKLKWRDDLERMRTN
jgi:hypothetical protein